MPETIHVRGEGGSIIAMDLPLPDHIQERVDKGLIVRVNADGSPFGVEPKVKPKATTAWAPTDLDSEAVADPPAEVEKPAPAKPPTRSRRKATT